MRCRPARAAAAIAVAAGMLAASAPLLPASACGGLVTWTEAYLHAKDDRGRLAALEELAAGCSDEAGGDRAQLRMVLADAAARGFPERLLKAAADAHKLDADLPGSSATVK